MTDVWIFAVLTAVLAVATVALAVALGRLRTRSGDASVVARGDTDDLRERLDGLERRLASAAPPPLEPSTDGPPEFVITDLPGTASTPAVPDRTVAGPPQRIDGRLFADLVLRETVVKTAGLAHGVRRALSPENRFRMRYEMTREMKRSRKLRRQELRAARRYLQSRRRAEEDAA